MPTQYKKHKKSKTEEKGKEEQDLERLLFGDLDESVWEKVGREVNDDDDDQESIASDKNDEGNEPTFFLDAIPEFTMDSEPTPTVESDVDVSSDEEEDLEPKEDLPEYNGKAAWVDDDDANLQVSLKGTDRLRKLRKTEEEDVISGAEYERRLRRQAASIYPRPQWAMLPDEKKMQPKKRKAAAKDTSDVEEDSADEQLDDDERVDLLKSTYGIMSNRQSALKLQPDFIDIARMNDANQTSRANGVISAVAFHPNANVMLTGSMDKTLRLFQIDGKVNPKIQSSHFKDTPIYSAAFHPSGDQIIITSRRKYYYIYDVQAGGIDKCPGIWDDNKSSLERLSMSPCGKYMAFMGTSGNISLVSYRTKQWAGNLKMNGHVISVDWSPDGKYLFAIGNDGFFYQFDIGERRCVKRWQDVDSYNATSLSVSPDMNYITTGLGSGIVNFYDRSVLDTDNQKSSAAMTIDNLTTSITDIKFNHDSQIVALASSKQSDAFRLAHLPSGKVFSNWPTERTPLNRVTAMDFSADSNYMAIGNAKGNVLLYALKHYIQ